MSQQTLTQLMDKVKPQSASWNLVKKKKLKIQQKNTRKINKKKSKLKKKITGLPKKPQKTYYKHEHNKCKDEYDKCKEKNDKKSSVIFMSHFNHQTQQKNTIDIIKCKTCLTYPSVVDGLCDLCSQSKPSATFVLQKIGDTSFNKIKLL